MHGNRRDFIHRVGLGVGVGLVRSFHTSLEARAEGALLGKVESAAEPELHDIRWEKGPRLPWACKGHAQGVIGDWIVGAGGAQLKSPDQVPPEVGFDRDDNFSKYPYSSWGKGAWLLDTRTLKYEILPEAPVGFHWPQGVAVGQDLYLFTGYIREPDERELDLLRGRGPDARDYWHPRNHAGRDVTSNRMFRLSRRSGQWKWQEMAPLRIGRFIPGAAVAGSAIVVVGGTGILGCELLYGRLLWCGHQRGGSFRHRGGGARLGGFASYSVDGARVHGYGRHR